MKHPKIWMGAAAGALLLSSLYASQALGKLDRTLGERIPLSVCRFECYCERNPFLGMNLPLPAVTCVVALPKGQKVLDWKPGANAWALRKA